MEMKNIKGRLLDNLKITINEDLYGIEHNIDDCGIAALMRELWKPLSDADDIISDAVLPYINHNSLNS